MRQVRIAMAQINTTVGDLEGNTAKILDAIQRAKQEDVDIVTFRNWRSQAILRRICCSNLSFYMIIVWP